MNIINNLESLNHKKEYLMQMYNLILHITQITIKAPYVALIKALDISKSR